MIQKKLVILSLVAIALSGPVTAAEKKSKPAAAKPAKGSGFAGLRDRYVRTFLRRFPVVGTYLGAEGLEPSLASLNGKLRDYSPAGLRSERQDWEGFSRELAAVDRKKLSEAEAIDADVMTAQLAFLVHNLDRQTHEKALDVYLEEPLRGVEWLLQGMTKTGDTTYGTRSEWKAVIDRVEAIPGYLAKAQANIKRGAATTSLPDRRLILASVKNAASTKEYFDKTLPKKATDWMQPSVGLERFLLAASEPAAHAFDEFRKALVELYFDEGGKKLKAEYDRDRFALGEVEYSWALKNNLRVSRTPKDLHTYGKAKVQETLTEMTALAKQVATSKGFPDGSLAAVFKRLGDDVPRTDEQMLESYRAACQKLVEYGRKNGLFDPPADYKLDVVFTPPPLRETTTAAYYPAPAFKKTGVGQFYVTPTGDDPAALREHARSAVASLAVHEGFPGHDWYYKFMTSKRDAISPVRWLTPGGVEDSSSMWADSMASEGWALYCEQLVGEPRGGAPYGYYTAEEKLFQLQGQLFRDARVVVDTGLHCGYMTFEEAVAYFARNVMFVKGAVSTEPAQNADAGERAMVESARKEIYRYSGWPTQAITYHLGKAEILALREEVRKIEGPKFDERRFHEAFMTQGAIPPGTFREALLAAARKRAEAP